MVWTVNTSNASKQEEFRKYLGPGTRFLERDLEEPWADELTVVRYKASQFKDVLVDDVSLLVPGAAIGVNVRWLIAEMPRLAGKRAIFVCHLALVRGGQVEVYRAEQPGRLTHPPRGVANGFRPYFVPDGDHRTLSEGLSDELNPRFRAVQDLLAGRPWKVCEPLAEWSGEFQG